MKQNIGRVVLVAVCLALAQGVEAADKAAHEHEAAHGESVRDKESGKGRANSNLLSGMPKRGAGRIYSSLDEPSASEPKEFSAGALNLNDANVEDVLGLYQEISGRSVIRSGNLPEVGLMFRNESALTRREALQALDTVMAGHGIAMINFGSNYVKAVSAREAPMEAGPIVDWLPEKLPNSGTFIVYILHTKEDQLPRMIAPAIQPLAKLPNSILAVDSARMLVLRDYSCIIRQMLQMVDRMGPMTEPQPAPGRPRGGPVPGMGAPGAGIDPDRVVPGRPVRPLRRRRGSEGEAQSAGSPVNIQPTRQACRLSAGSSANATVKNPNKTPPTHNHTTVLPNIDAGLPGFKSKIPNIYRYSAGLPPPRPYIGPPLNLSLNLPT